MASIVGNEWPITAKEPYKRKKYQKKDTFFENNCIGPTTTPLKKDKKKLEEGLTLGQFIVLTTQKGLL